MEQTCRWHIYPSVEALTEHVVGAIAACARESIDPRGAFSIVLTGGNTPQPVYRGLRAIDTNWSAWHVYFGDERCLPIDDSQRNNRMAMESLLDHVPIPREQIFPMPGELGAEEGALAYREVLRPVGQFDLVLLGLGEDGHVASLFPDHALGDSSKVPAVLAVHGAPKAPPERISLSASRLGRSRQVWVLVCGEAKREAVTHWREGREIPARHVVPTGGVDIFADTAAAG